MSNQYIIELLGHCLLVPISVSGICLLIAWGMTFIVTVHFSFYAIPLLIYDVMYDIATTR